MKNAKFKVGDTVRVTMEGRLIGSYSDHSGNFSKVKFNPGFVIVEDDKLKSIDDDFDNDRKQLEEAKEIISSFVKPYVDGGKLVIRNPERYQKWYNRCQDFLDKYYGRERERKLLGMVFHE